MLHLVKKTPCIEPHCGTYYLEALKFTGNIHGSPRSNVADVCCEDSLYRGKHQFDFKFSFNFLGAGARACQGIASISVNVFSGTYCPLV